MAFFHFKPDLARAITKKNIMQFAVPSDLTNYLTADSWLIFSREPISQTPFIPVNMDNRFAKNNEKYKI